LIKKLQNFCFRHKLFLPNQSLVVGFSGGPDSTALVLFLNHLKKSWKLKIFLLHINYGLRGKASLADEKFCFKMAKKLALPIKLVTYKSFSTGGSANLEERLRDFRYSELEKEREKRKADWIAVGHTLDDSAETFLFNLIRGAGLRGLVALRAKNGKIIRPLLGVRKKEILAFLKEKKQSFRLDKSNQSLKFSRNRIRLQLLPELEKKYNPQIKKRLVDLQEHLLDVEEWLERETKKLFLELVRKENWGWSMERKSYENLSRAERKSLFRLIMFNLQGNLKNISANAFWELEKMILSNKSKNQEIFLKKTRIYRQGEKIIFSIKEEE